MGEWFRSDSLSSQEKEGSVGLAFSASFSTAS